MNVQRRPGAIENHRRRPWDGTVPLHECRRIGRVLTLVAPGVSGRGRNRPRVQLGRRSGGLVQLRANAQTGGGFE